MRRLAGRGAGRVSTLLAGAAVTLAVASCSAGDDDPDGVTVGEARALEQAAEMLDERRRPDAALPDAHETGRDDPVKSDR